MRHESQRPSAGSRAAHIFSALSSSMHICDPLDALSAPARGAVIAAVAELLARGVTDRVAADVVDLLRDKVPGFADSWRRLEPDASRSRLFIVEELARGRYRAGDE